MKDQQFREQFRILYDQFQKAFPKIKPPEVRWWALWMNKYDAACIAAAISAAAVQYPTGKTTEDIGRVISAKLRDEALVQTLAEEVSYLVKPEEV